MAMIKKLLLRESLVNVGLMVGLWGVCVVDFETEQKKITTPSTIYTAIEEDEHINCQGILYINDNQWCVWLNNDCFTSKQPSSKLTIKILNNKQAKICIKHTKRCFVIQPGQFYSTLNKKVFHQSK